MIRLNVKIKEILLLIYEEYRGVWIRGIRIGFLFLSLKYDNFKLLLSIRSLFVVGWDVIVMRWCFLLFVFNVYG